MAKPIYFTRHAREQMRARRATAEEIEAVIRGASWRPAEQGRLTAARAFPFRQEHFERFYESKDVVPVFVEEAERIVVITVYTFFSQREVQP